MHSEENPAAILSLFVRPIFEPAMQMQYRSTSLYLIPNPLVWQSTCCVPASMDTDHNQVHRIRSDIFPSISLIYSLTPFEYAIRIFWDNGFNLAKISFNSFINSDSSEHFIESHCSSAENFAQSSFTCSPSTSIWNSRS